MQICTWLLVYLSQNAGSVASPSRTSSGGTSSGTSRSASAQDESSRGFVAVVLADTEDVWTDQFKKISKTYRAPQLVLFSGSTRSGCGTAGASVGPFYCPADQKVYLDTRFFDDLAGTLGAKGDTASAYVIAHEVGHHVQHLLGIESKSSVTMELQADCFAGVWAAQMERTKKVIEAGDIDEALGAASAVGDDRLQSRSGGQVVPDSFTHGSSTQRVGAFRRGYQGAELQACL